MSWTASTRIQKLSVSSSQMVSRICGPEWQARSGPGFAAVQIACPENEITAELTDASGLLRGDVVKAAGVTVGRVEEIGIRDGRVGDGVARTDAKHGRSGHVFSAPR